MEAAIYSRRKNIMVVQHNVTAMNTSRQLGITTTGLQKSTEKLSSGYKINRAADDAAGLSISEKMRNQIRGLNKAASNAQDGISLVQTAEGALNEVHSMLQRISELAVQASSDINATADRTAVNDEITQLTTEIDRVASTTQFNKMNILDGTFKDKSIQVGANAGENIAISIDNMNCATLGMTNAGVDSYANANTTLTNAQNAITSLSSKRSALGAIQNRLEHTYDNLNNISENTQAAESRIRDTDMASEMVSYSKNNILQQAGQSMLAQANQANQGVLSLLQ
jgi:flagellin